jgi:hypothetical protein
LTTRGVRYGDFAHRINVDDFEEAIEWSGDDDGKGQDVGFCPDPWGLHSNGDTTGKFAIHRDKRVFNCWVCGGGSLLSLAMGVRNLYEEEATEWIKQFAGEQTDQSFENEIEDLLRDEIERDPVTPWFNPRVLDNMDASAARDDMWIDWLDSKGINESVARDHKLGLNLAEVKISKKGRYEGPGITLPHFWGGKLVGWQTRWLDADKDRPPWVQKYNNTRDFPKKYTIYDYERWYLSQDPIVVVESVPTALYLQSLGFASMAVFGASVTPEQLRLMRACQQGLILAPDNDKAGDLFMEKVLAYGLTRYVDVKYCEVVGEEDSGNDLADAGDDKLVKGIIENALDLDLIV